MKFLFTMLATIWLGASLGLCGIVVPNPEIHIITIPTVILFNIAIYLK